MATYGGGLTFSITQDFAQQSGIVTSQSYVVPLPAVGYTLFKPLSITGIGGGGLINGNVSLVVQNDNGVGGFCNAYEFFFYSTGGGSVNIGGGIGINPIVGANDDGYLVLNPGQRVVFGTNLSSGTVRFNFMYFEYEPS